MGAPAGGDVAEEHLIALLVLAPHMARRLPVRLAPEELRRPECREVYRAILHDPFGPLLDTTLQDYYDAVRTHARRQPPQTDSQLEADLAGVVHRIKERNLREQLREAHYLLAEAGTGDERAALARRVERLAAQLARVHLERSRSALYTAPPN